MKGKIHSLESFGTVDGPGIRYVVFFQGCPMRCLYCHNPDTWDSGDGEWMESGEIIGNILRNREFYASGGLTATGGEPLMQMDFLSELFRQAKAAGIHTALDTSGALFDEKSTDRMDELMANTDLVLLDIKELGDADHRVLTGRGNGNILAFARYLAAIKKSVWVRHVVVPGITNEPKKLYALGRFLAGLPNVEKLEVLPYHSMGRVKYESMGLSYPLADTPQLTRAEAAAAEALIREGMAAGKK